MPVGQVRLSARATHTMRRTPRSFPTPPRSSASTHQSPCACVRNDGWCYSSMGRPRRRAFRGTHDVSAALLRPGPSTDRPAREGQNREIEDTAGLIPAGESLRLPMKRKRFITGQRVSAGGLAPHCAGPISNHCARALAWWCVPRGDEVVGLHADLLGVSVWGIPQPDRVQTRPASVRGATTARPSH